MDTFPEYKDSLTMHAYLTGLWLALSYLPVAWAGPVVDTGENTHMTLVLESPSFLHNSNIPAIHTCDGVNVSPQLTWAGLPAGTKSLALIVDDPDAPDPDAPKMTWVHWILYNMLPSASGLPENVAAERLPTPTLQGINDWKRTGYGGPCPPIGQHRYFFKLYALDTLLPDLRQPAKAQLEKAMQGHVIAHAELIGKYQRAR